jgi:aromatic ring hydroxylase
VLQRKARGRIEFTNSDRLFLVPLYRWFPLLEVVQGRRKGRNPGAGATASPIEAWEGWPLGYATPNRRIMNAALNWCQEHHTEIIDVLRTLLGGAPLQMPASIDVIANPELRDRFERWWKTPSISALDRMKLYKLAWDISGSEFAGRHIAVREILCR